MPEGMHEIEVLVSVNDDGDYAVGYDLESLKEECENKMGELPVLSQVIRIRLLVPEVKATELTGEVPAQGNVTGTLTSL